MNDILITSKDAALVAIAASGIEITNDIKVAVIKAVAATAKTIIKEQSK
jgi:hypothetical protein